MSNNLNVQSISKSYKKRQVVKSVSFELNSSQVVGLLGPNGAGKTTCFYIASGLLRADKGKVLLNGNNITRLPIDKRALLGIGYLAQEASIFRYLSVEKNILAALEALKLKRTCRYNRLEEILSEFKLDHIRHNNGISLSGGERRRVEIARIIAINPKFILLDEPFAGVDPIAVKVLQRLIAKLVEQNIGVLITDHNFREMLDICDKNYVLSDGEIIANGDKKTILQCPQVKQSYLGEHSNYANQG